MSKLVVNIDNETLNFEIGDINVYNILSSIAVLKELKIDIHKFKNNFKDLDSSDGRGKISDFKI